MLETKHNNTLIETSQEVSVELQCCFHGPCAKSECSPQNHPSQIMKVEWLMSWLLDSHSFHSCWTAPCKSTVDSDDGKFHMILVVLKSTGTVVWSCLTSDIKHLLGWEWKKTGLCVRWLMAAVFSSKLLNTDRASACNEILFSNYGLKLNNVW